MDENKRLIYPDFLRIISAFAVIVIHCVGVLWNKIPVLSKSWVALTLIDSLFRFAVPVFVMVSGMFMLSPSKKHGIKELFLKRILRIITSFAFWSIIYIFCNQILMFISDKSSFKLDFFSVFKSFIVGEYHLWFLYMIAGLYIVTPLLQKLVEKKSTIQYFLAIWFIFCLTPNFIKLIPGIGDYVFQFFSYFKISIAIEYSGFYILGYYLHNYIVGKPARISIYILACISTVIVALMTVIISFKSSKAISDYFEYLLPTTALQSSAVFLCVKNKFHNYNFSKNAKKIIFTLSKISFGVYLSHVLVINVMFKLCFQSLSLPTYVIFSVLLIATVIISSIISFLLNKIPGLSKHIL